jgi:hypothetical protein
MRYRGETQDAPTEAADAKRLLKRPQAAGARFAHGDTILIVTWPPRLHGEDRARAKILPPPQQTWPGMNADFKRGNCRNLTREALARCRCPQAGWWAGPCSTPR